ncbi:MAG: nucleoside hydrolase [Lachnospiraceae bacterium]|nr:nucleoside hydrolase [Lachnospiraceae bacterium]
MEEKRIRIILDGDPGHDDAVNFMLACGSPRFEVLGITTVAGNQTLENTTRNALNLMQALELDVPVYRGCSQAMVREHIAAGDIHGKSGMDGPVFEPLRRTIEAKHAVNFIIDTLMESEEPVTLVPTGPLTNVAMAIRMEPRILPKIEQIVLMGGCYQLGNRTPAAEFNIYDDPEAAHIVFTCGRPLTMIGLDVTRKCLCTPEVIERMEKIGNRASQIFADLMRFFSSTQKKIYGWSGGPLHDPLTCAYLIDPSVLTVRRMYTEIDHGCYGPSYGRTNCDFFGRTAKSREANADVAVDVDVEKYWDIIEAGLRAYSR